jgi:hypothetical protein
MISKWFELKNKAIAFRKNGKSIRDIEEKLGVPKSTLSGWFKDIKLSKSQKKVLDRKWKLALSLSRKKAVIWHNKQKAERLKKAEKDALETIGSIDFHNKYTLELALAMLYLGEGFKTSATGIGNSDPLILNFFIRSMEKLYGFSREKIKCYLHLRADQNPYSFKRYWSHTLKIPISNFMAVSLDQRTLGKKTYKSYKGVCILNFGTVAIQRKLLYLSKEFSKRIIEN